MIITRSARCSPRQRVCVIITQQVPIPVLLSFFLDCVKWRPEKALREDTDAHEVSKIYFQPEVAAWPRCRARYQGRVGLTRPSRAVPAGKKANVEKRWLESPLNAVIIHRAACFVI